MKNNKAKYNFTVKEVPEGYKITYFKDKYGFKLGCGIFILMLFLSCLIPNIFGSSMQGAVLSWLVFSLGGTFLVVYLINRARKNGEFVIRKDGIDINQAFFDMADIQKIYIKDPKGNFHRTTAHTQNGFLVGGKGIQGGMMVGAAVAANSASNAARASSEMINSAIHKVNFKIEFLYGNKTVSLAKGLTEQNAYVLFDKILELMEKR